MADVVTVELDTLHRFEHEWEADATLALRNGDPTVVDTYNQHGRIHGHTDQTAVIEAVINEAFAGIVDGRDVLVMAPTNTVVEQLNLMLTDRLLSVGWLDADSSIEIGGLVF